MLKKSNSDFDSIKVEFSNSNTRNEEDQIQADNAYIEFHGLTKVRSATSLNDEFESISDSVRMNAHYKLDANGKNVNDKRNFLFKREVHVPLSNSKKYDNFHTIDWVRDLAKDRYRHRWLEREQLNGGFFQKVQKLNDAWSGWICVLLVAMAAGIVAGMIDIGASWMENLKSGVCKKAFWLNREQCCWASKNTTDNEYNRVSCQEWHSWSHLFGYNDEDESKVTSSTFIEFFAHIGFSVIFALIGASFVKVFAPYACGSGIPEIKTILGGFVIRSYLGKWTLLIKSIGMMLSTSAGLTLGKEGPFVHVACCCGNIFSYLFPKYGYNEAKKREILSAGAAAGVAVAFGAPIGGVLFSLEEVSYYFPLKTMWRSFFCAMFAAFIVRLVNPYDKKHYILFFIDYKPDWFFFELLPFILIGILGGLFGVLFIKLNIIWCRKRKTTSLGRFPITEVVVVTLVTSIIGYFNPYTRMSMSDLVRQLVAKCNIGDESYLCDYNRTFTNAKDIIPLAAASIGVHNSIWMLFLALLFYIVMIIFTFGIKIPCGLFVPSLTIGAITGRIIGIGVEQLAFYYPDFFLFGSDCEKSKECIVPGVYALVGACAFLGGVTRMTVSLVVIMVELTSGMSLIVPLMVTALTAKFVGEFMGVSGIYDAHIELNGYPFLDNKEEYCYMTKAIDVMTPKSGEPPLTSLTQDNMTIGEIESVINQSKFTGYPIVVSKESQNLFGYILRRDLIDAFEQYRKKNDRVLDDTLVYFNKTTKRNTSEQSIRLHKLVDLAPICVTNETPMEIILDLFRKMGVGIVLVTHQGRLLGVISKKDILEHLNEMKKKHD